MEERGANDQNHLAGTLRRELHCIAWSASDASDCQLFAARNGQPSTCL